MGHNPYRHYLIRLAVYGGLYGILTLLMYLITDLPQPHVWAGMLTLMAWRTIGRKLL